MRQGLVAFVMTAAIAAAGIETAAAGGITSIGDQKRTIIFVPCDKKPKPKDCDVKF